MYALGRVFRKFVVPGDLIARLDIRPPPNTYKIGNCIYSLKVGLSEIEGRNIRVIPLAGKYVPRVDDIVIGVVTDLNAFAWIVDINSFFPAYLPASDVFGRRYSPEVIDLTKKFDIGDVMLARIAAFDRTKDPMLTVSEPKLGKLNTGHLVKISPVKVPRLIGRKGSMSKLIEQTTGTRLIIGQNGVVLVTGPPDKVPIAIRAIEMVEEEAHLAGLTEDVQNFLSGKMAGKQVHADKKKVG